jgi:hypothetical protein
VNAVTAERRMFETKTPVMGGAQTAERVARDQAAHGMEAGGAVGRLFNAGLALAAHEPVLAASLGTGGLRGIAQNLSQPSAAVREQMARMLFEQRQALNQKFLADLAARYPGYRLGAPLVAPAAQTLGPMPGGFLNSGRGP